MTSYQEHLLTSWLIYSTAALFFELLVSRSGCVLLCGATFFAIGSYSTVYWGAQWTDVLFASLVASFLSMTLVVPLWYSMRALEQDERALVSFGLQAVVFSLCLNWRAATGGVYGRSVPVLGGTESDGVENADMVLCYSITLLASTIMFVKWMRSSCIGRLALAAATEAEWVTLAGGNVSSLQLVYLAIGAAGIAFAGAINAHSVGFVDASLASLDQSVALLAMSLVGQRIGLWGPLVGASIVVVLPESLRLIGVTNSVSAHVRQIICALAIVTGTCDLRVLLVAVSRTRALCARARR